MPGRILPYAVLLISSVVLYRKALGFDFVPSWDDGNYVLDNPYIRSLSLDNIKGIFTTTFVGNYAPLQILSYALDYAFWGLNPKGYHLSNIILHGLNACGAYAVIRRITGEGIVAFMAALLFLVHPLNVENVAWVSERKTLLATLFFFLSMIYYLDFRNSNSPKFYGLSIIFFILALLSKSTVVILPLILIAYEFFIARNEHKWSALVPFFALSAAGAILAIWAQLNDSSIERSVIDISSLFGIVYPTMTTVVWKYVGLIFRPFNLIGFYDTIVYRSFLEAPVIVSVAAWIIVFILALRKTDPLIRFWFLWFWICLLPVSNIIPIRVYYADRYMYLPSITFFVLIGFIVKKLIGNIKPVAAATGNSIYSSKRARICYAAFALVVVYYSALAYNRMDVWRNELVFWEDTARKSPNLYKARLNLGVAYERLGRLADAEREYLAAISLFPGDEAAFNLRMTRAKMRLNQ